MFKDFLEINMSLSYILKHHDCTLYTQILYDWLRRSHDRNRVTTSIWRTFEGTVRVLCSSDITRTLGAQEAVWAPSLSCRNVQPNYPTPPPPPNTPNIDLRFE